MTSKDPHTNGKIWPYQCWTHTDIQDSYGYSTMQKLVSDQKVLGKTWKSLRQLDKCVHSNTWQRAFGNHKCYFNLPASLSARICWYFKGNSRNSFSDLNVRFAFLRFVSVVSWEINNTIKTSKYLWINRT